MTEMISDHELLKLITLSKLRKLIQREGQGWQNVLHKRVGFGLTGAEFTEIVKTLERNNWVTCSDGKRGGVLVKFNQAFQNVVVNEPTAQQE